VFDRYFTTRRGEGGTGLGMYVVRRLANRLGADVRIDSTSGIGTTVILSIPEMETDSPVDADSP
jgi:signal transduction histidine kinase